MPNARQLVALCAACAASAWLPAAASATTPGPAGGEERLSAPEKKHPLPYLFLAPTHSARVDSADIQRILATQLERDTNLVLQPIEELADHCDRRVACMAARLASDPRPKSAIRPASPDRGAEPERAHALLILTRRQASDDRADVLAAQLLDLDVAEGLRAACAGNSLRNEACERSDALEQQIWEHALVAEQTASVSDLEAVERFCAELLGRARPSFERSQNWRQLGGVALSAPAGLVIQWDDRAIGITGAGPVTIRAPAGRHRLSLEHPQFSPYRAEVDVVAGQVLGLDAAVERRMGTGESLRRATLWSGVGLAAAGAALTTYAIVHAGSRAQVTCLRGMAVDGARCGTAEFIGTGSASNPNGGVLLAPLGYSAIGVGATWALGSALFTAPDEVPWPSLLIGLGVGVLGYGLSAHFNGGDAYAR